MRVLPRSSRSLSRVSRASPPPASPPPSSPTINLRTFRASVSSTSNSGIPSQDFHTGAIGSSPIRSDAVFRAIDTPRHRCYTCRRLTWQVSESRAKTSDACAVARGLFPYLTVSSPGGERVTARSPRWCGEPRGPRHSDPGKDAALPGMDAFLVVLAPQHIRVVHATVSCILPPCGRKGESSPWRNTFAPLWLPRLP